MATVPENQKTNDLAQDDEGNFIVVVPSSALNYISKNSSSASLRERTLKEKLSVAKDENLPILNRLLTLRLELAQMLGYESYAHFRLSKKMNPNPENVLLKLQNLTERLGDNVAKELEPIFDLKIKSDPDAKSLDYWDISYYMNQYSKQSMNIDVDTLNEYFPFSYSFPKILELYENLFNIRFVKVDQASVWHEDVTLYNIVDNVDNTVLAQVYMDLFARPDKYDYPRFVSLVMGRTLEKGKEIIPVSVLICDFDKKQPLLLSHNDIARSLMHELGHVVHYSFNESKYARFSGIEEAQDFMEAPGLLFEYWAWNPEVLRKISAQYENYLSNKKVEPLPEDLLKNFKSFSRMRISYDTAFDVMLSIMDLRYHMDDPKNIDTTEIWYDLQKALLTNLPPEGSARQASWGHLADYSASYYEYVFSSIYAADMYSKFNQTGLLNPDTGEQLRKTILEQGSWHDIDEMLESFLGRPSNSQAFFESLK